MSTMTLNDVLLDLLTHLRAENKPIMVCWDTVQQWPEGALDRLLQLGILVPASVAQSVVCNACDNHCFTDVITLPHNDLALTRAFILCDDTEMQSQMGRIQIPLSRLQQWQGSVKQLAMVIADLLELKDTITFTLNHPIIKLGMLKSLKGRRWVTLDSLDLSLEINKYTVPIDEVLYFEGEQLIIDHDCIDELLDRKPLTQGKTYTPSTSRREARKLETQAMYKDWNDEYLRLKEQHPTKTDSWCAFRIAKMDIAKGRDSGTIRKNMI